MIYVKTDVQRLEYDIHSLIKAFCPEEAVKVLYERDEEACRGIVFDYEILLNHNPPQIIKNNKESGIKNVFIANEPFQLKQETLTLTKEEKHQFKRFLYQTMEQVCRRELPWGNLTGIRPTKIAMSMLGEGKSDEDILSFMEREHFVSAKKSRLALDIAHREQKLLKSLHIENGYSLYIGIPFCPTRCLYCSFPSNPICVYKDRTEEYLGCLEKEMRYVSNLFQTKTLDSIYIGGGTPTTLSKEQLNHLLSLVETYFDVSGLLEFTVEAGRADSITKEKLEVLKKHHVKRISVNPQTMRDETLIRIGRQHTAQQVREAFYLAKEVGFDNINMDMILGLPGETEEDVAYTVSELEKLSPDSLTVHSLAIKRASKLRGWVEENGFDGIRNTDETMAVAAAGAKKMGMVPYYLYRQKNMSGNLENVGYAKPGKFGVYNILINEEVQTIAALGAGSISKRVYPDGRIERCDNVKDVDIYMEKIDEMIERKRRLLSE